MLKKILLIIIVAFAFNSLIAQNVEFTKDNFPGRKKELKTAIKNIEEGDKFYTQARSGMYLQALRYYKLSYDFNPDNAILNYKIGKCYLNSIEKTRSIPYFQKALELDPKNEIFRNTDIHYLLAQALHFNMEFDKAIEEYKIYKKDLPQNDAYLIGEINNKIKSCELGKEMVANPARAFSDIIEGVNSKLNDHSPIVNADESIMFFTSRRAGTTGDNVDPADLLYYEDMYYITNSGSGESPKWSNPVNPGSPLNSKEHDAIVGITNDGQKLFIYKGENNGDIYESYLKGNRWGKPQKLEYPINTEFKETSASFSFDGRTVYFVSDRDGGIGKQDIYVCKRNLDGTWGEVKNLKAPINTIEDEEGVFMHPDGKTLFFSSRGHETMGGYDIFSSTLQEDGSWSKPRNLGYPINTPDDDVFLSISASGKHGYYSSVKTDGIGYQDIYMITFLGPEKQLIVNTEHPLLASKNSPVSEKIIEKQVEITTQPVTIVKGMIFDESTKHPVHATIELVDNEKNELLAVFESNATSGKYLISLPAGRNYGIAVKAPEYLFHSENFVVPLQSSYQEIVKDIALQKVEVGKKVVLNNIFFDVGKATLRPESYAELGILKKLLVENPSLKVEISGHTDNTGSNQLNQTLSENRAKAVVEYLVTQGIEQSRMRYAGYGESQPIATNETAEGRQKNRRTEFKILEF